MSAAPTTGYQPVFSEGVQRALAKWPNVPACHGFLTLDRRGRWRVDGGVITHPGAVAFLNRHYASDGNGRWYVQNGPQTAYVDLELAPWILSIAPDGALSTHTGMAVDGFGALFVTDAGDVLVDTPLGLAAIADRDLSLFAGGLRTPDGADALDVLAGLGAGAEASVATADGVLHPVRRVDEAALLARYAIERRPRA